jgi:hypothetical protein
VPQRRFKERSVADENNQLVRYDTMCQAIAAAYEVDEVKDIRDRAAALEHYSRMAHHFEAERRCCEIRLRAERKAGILLRQMEKAKGAREPGSNRGMTRSDAATASKTLGDLGITKDQSSQWQRLADVPEDTFEAALAGPVKPTTTWIITGAGAKPRPVSTQALWLWGRLEEFKRQALDRDPGDFLDTLTPGMRDDIRSLRPRVIKWLEQLGEELECQEQDVQKITVSEN